MKISTIALATVFAISSSSLALATTHKHHLKHHAMNHSPGMTTGMARTGPSGPRMDGGGVDKSRAGGEGVSRKASE